MEQITSLKNPKIALWKSLKDHSSRDRTGLFLVEGRKSVEEALASRFEADTLLIEDQLEDQYPIPEGIQTFVLPDYIMKAVCDTKTPQGIAAVMRRRDEHVTDGRIVALDGVQDPGNVGTIIRTADAAGFDGVLLSGQCADPYSPKVLRATMGSIFHLPVCTAADFPGELCRLAGTGMAVVSTQLDGEPFYERTHLGRRFVLVIGSEGNGVTPEVRALATHRYRLPMSGEAESLNAAVAAGIMMYDLTYRSGTEGENQ